jgi:hypothetical protein
VDGLSPLAVAVLAGNTHAVKVLVDGDAHLSGSRTVTVGMIEPVFTAARRVEEVVFLAADPSITQLTFEVEKLVRGGDDTYAAFRTFTFARSNDRGRLRARSHALVQAAATLHAVETVSKLAAENLGANAANTSAATPRKGRRRTITASVLSASPHPSSTAAAISAAAEEGVIIIDERSSLSAALAFVDSLIHRHQWEVVQAVVKSALVPHIQRIVDDADHRDDAPALAVLTYDGRSSIAAAIVTGGLGRAVAWPREPIPTHAPRSKCVVLSVAAWVVAARWAPAHLLQTLHAIRPRAAVGIDGPLLGLTAASALRIPRRGVVTQSQEGTTAFRLLFMLSNAAERASIVKRVVQRGVAQRVFADMADAREIATKTLSLTDTVRGGYDSLLHELLQKDTFGFAPTNTETTATPASPSTPRGRPRLAPLVSSPAAATGFAPSLSAALIDAASANRAVSSVLASVATITSIRSPHTTQPRKPRLTQAGALSPTPDALPANHLSVSDTREAILAAAQLGRAKTVAEIYRWKPSSVTAEELIVAAAKSASRSFRVVRFALTHAIDKDKVSEHVKLHAVVITLMVGSEAATARTLQRVSEWVAGRLVLYGRGDLTRPYALDAPSGLVSAAASVSDRTLDGYGGSFTALTDLFPKVVPLSAAGLGAAPVPSVRVPDSTKQRLPISVRQVDNPGSPARSTSPSAAWSTGRRDGTADLPRFGSDTSGLASVLASLRTPPTSAPTAAAYDFCDEPQNAEDIAVLRSALVALRDCVRRHVADGAHCTCAGCEGIARSGGFIMLAAHQRQFASGWRRDWRWFSAARAELKNWLTDDEPGISRGDSRCGRR